LTISFVIIDALLIALELCEKGSLKNELIRLSSEEYNNNKIGKKKQSKKSKARLKQHLHKLIRWCKQIAKGMKLLEDLKVMEKETK